MGPAFVSVKVSKVLPFVPIQLLLQTTLHSWTNFSLGSILEVDRISLLQHQRQRLRTQVKPLPKITSSPNKEEWHITKWYLVRGQTPLCWKSSCPKWVALPLEMAAEMVGLNHCLRLLWLWGPVGGSFDRVIWVYYLHIWHGSNNQEHHRWYDKFTETTKIFKKPEATHYHLNSTCISLKNAAFQASLHLSITPDDRERMLEVHKNFLKNSLSITLLWSNLKSAKSSIW